MESNNEPKSRHIKSSIDLLNPTTTTRNFLKLIEDHPKNRHKYLEYVLDVHQNEVNDDTFEKGCYYCRDVIKGSRSTFLEHLFNKHFLQLGKIENLVFIDELLEFVEQKIKDLTCLYCEKIFRDRKTLKEHMRKKGHKRINPENELYDKYFLINYYKSETDRKVVEMSNQSKRKKLPICREGYRNIRYRDKTSGDNKSVDGAICDTLDNLDDSDWSVWETEDNVQITCLFCLHSETSIMQIKNHMTRSHAFDFDAVINKLNFYQKVKFVNYIRRQVSLIRCINCDAKFNESDQKGSALEKLLEHMANYGHFQIDDMRRYNQPEYFFPTVEDDPFLCFLEDTYEDSDLSSCNDDSANVICEDIKAQLNVNAEIFIAENFLKDADF